VARKDSAGKGKPSLVEELSWVLALGGVRRTKRLAGYGRQMPGEGLKKAES